MKPSGNSNSPSKRGDAKLMCYQPRDFVPLFTRTPRIIYRYNTLLYILIVGGQMAIDFSEPIYRGY
jgi:hypothetical protein